MSDLIRGMHEVAKLLDQVGPFAQQITSAHVAAGASGFGTSNNDHLKAAGAHIDKARELANQASLEIENAKHRLRK
jgi:hypothetical protein